MKNKKILWLFLFSFLLGGVLFFAQTVWGQGPAGIEFEPNVRIPGTSAFSQEKTVITSASLGEYIVALYNYGAIFAGFVAMFMLVLAGWQWLLAGGSLDKISRAKNTINGVLVGLALLFGGYLLMSQISNRLVNFDALNIEPIGIQPGMEQICQDNLINITGCNEVVNTTTSAFGQISCVGQMCDGAATCMDTRQGADCPKVVSRFASNPNCSCIVYACDQQILNGCDDYQDQVSCITNRCLGQPMQNGQTFNQTCSWQISTGGVYACDQLQGASCDHNSTCDFDGTGNWCCANRRGFDSCQLRAQSTCGND